MKPLARKRALDIFNYSSRSEYVVFLDLWLMENWCLIRDRDIEWEKHVIVVLSTDDVAAIGFPHQEQQRSIV